MNTEFRSALVVFCGGIAAGKTHLRRRWTARALPACPHVPVVVSTDVMATALAGLAPAAGTWSPAGAARLQAVASAAGEALLGRCLARGVPVVWETTLAWPGSPDGAEALAWFARFRAAGYMILVQAVTCPPALAAARAAARGGRPLDPARLAESHALFRRLVPTYAAAADRFRLWDTSGPAPGSVGSSRSIRPRLEILRGPA